MGATIIDLVSDSDEEEKDDDAGVVETKVSATLLTSKTMTSASNNNNGGKRKIVEEESKKEPNRKNPWFRNSNTAPGSSSSAFSSLIQSTGLTFVQRVSPVLEDDDDEVIIVDGKENPPNFTSLSAKGAKKVWPRKAATRTTNSWLAAADTATTKTIKDSIGSSLKSKSEPPLKIWCDSDNAVITPGVLPALGTLRGGNLLVSNAVSVPHIQQSDNWSCGFRNIQMLLSGLVPLLPSTHPYFQSITHVYSKVPTHLFLGTSSLLVLPSLTQLQQQLEACWREGFDPNGADHFKHSVVGRPARIGAVEVGFVLTYWWLDACVVQFIKCFQSRRLLPPFVYHYFRACYGGDQSARETAMTCLDLAEMGTSSISGNETAAAAAAAAYTTNTVLPMYLQWEGHSVTIVGIEPPPGAVNGDIGKYSWSQWNLLVFCPGRNTSRIMAGKNTSTTTTAPFRLSCRQLLQKDCQVILSSTEPLSSSQRFDRKNKAFVVTAASEAVAEHAQRSW